MIELERWNHLRNDVYRIWIDSPGLTLIETLNLLRKRGLVERPQQGILDALASMREEFDLRPIVESKADSLDKDDSPLGSNPFMEG